MPEITVIIDKSSGALLIEDNAHLSASLLEQLQSGLGESQVMGCARPLEVLPPPLISISKQTGSECVRIAGYYHNSLTEGPGRRSSVLFQSCPLACKGCWVPHLHDSQAGALVPATIVADLLLDPSFERDGVSILGGEPFVQLDGLLMLVSELRARGCQHILCYSGYTYEALREKAIRQPAINLVLDEIDMLIDGPYIESLAESAGAWTGSGNQRVIDMRATRQSGFVVQY